MPWSADDSRGASPDAPEHKVSFSAEEQARLAAGMPWSADDSGGACSDAPEHKVSFLAEEQARFAAKMPLYSPTMLSNCTVGRHVFKVLPQCSYITLYALNTLSCTAG